MIIEIVKKKWEHKPLEQERWIFYVDMQDLFLKKYVHEMRSTARHGFNPVKVYDCWNANVAGSIREHEVPIPFTVMDELRERLMSAAAKQVGDFWVKHCEEQGKRGVNP
ncbi:hypothetical protein MKY59_20775 [Paenibacillus sp. FSL W8-0426]|uniref:hypothetical protein n=1 Tax=Paenibacillus sp. FSL W8-0426 TaxID=2921714 RepID=UPI0030D8AB00